MTTFERPDQRRNRLDSMAIEIALGREASMTTPNGQPSVQPSPRHLGEQLQDGSIASTQAHATGGGQYSGSGEPAPKIVGQYGTDVHSASTEGNTVGNDQSELNPTGTQPAP